MRSSVAVTRPPLTDPTYMDTNKTSADSLCIENVSGKANAINIAPVNPGIAPTTMPRNEPIATSTKAVGEQRKAIAESGSGGKDLSLLKKNRTIQGKSTTKISVNT